MALKLGMRKEVAQEAIDRLVKLRLIAKSGNQYLAMDVNLKTIDGVGSSSLKNITVKFWKKPKTLFTIKMLKIAIFWR